MKQIPETLYAPNYKVIGNCLYEIKNSKQGPYDKKLCNFTPWLVSEVTVDDGVETTSRIRLGGIHETGRTLPEIEIPTDELGSFNWLYKHWGIDCILEQDISVRDSIRYAIQITAPCAKRQTVYTVTGWRKVNDQWQFLMPGDDAQTVCLPGKTGSRKSTLAALFLPFFGRFTGAELPLSFQDTHNSILHHAFSLKDVLTCVDDFHPAGRMEETKLTAVAQSIMRAYGDRVGKGRLRPDSSPMEARPPQGNVIITAEFPPDLGESGTARYFSLELPERDVDLYDLSLFQRQAAKGALQRCMYGYVEWLRESCLRDPETEQRFLSSLRERFELYRSEFQKSGILCHGRVPETVSCLRLGMELFLPFLKAKQMLTHEEKAEMENQFRMILYRLAARQAESITQDKPTHKFIRKLYALLESGQVCVLNKNQHHDFVPQNCIGYEDDGFFYLHSEIAHKAVRKLCEEQGESFTISHKSLLKQMAEEGLIETASGQNTKSVRIGGKSKRLACLYKFRAQQILDTAL